MGCWWVLDGEMGKGAGVCAHICRQDMVPAATLCVWLGQPWARLAHPGGLQGATAWGLSLLTPCTPRLSGLSPFLGDNDTETLNNVLAANWYFDEETFETVSDEAKDFVSNLIIKDKRCGAGSSHGGPGVASRLCAQPLGTTHQQHLLMFCTNGASCGPALAAGCPQQSPLHL